MGDQSGGEWLIQSASKFVAEVSFGPGIYRLYTRQTLKGHHGVATNQWPPKGMIQSCSNKFMPVLPEIDQAQMKQVLLI